MHLCSKIRLDINCALSDRVRVIIQGESDCTVETVLTNDGTINMPYVGDLRLVGKNKRESESAIQREYVRKLIFARPKALLTITNYSERVVFLTGSVNRKGPYVFPPEVEAMNIVEVIARAGDLMTLPRKIGFMSLGHFLMKMVALPIPKPMKSMLKP